MPLESESPLENATESPLENGAESPRWWLGCRFLVCNLLPVVLRDPRLLCHSGRGSLLCAFTNRRADVPTKSLASSMRQGAQTVIITIMCSFSFLFLFFLLGRELAKIANIVWFVYCCLFSGCEPASGSSPGRRQIVVAVMYKEIL